jgi:ubiquitin-protein ligase
MIYPQRSNLDLWRVFIKGCDGTPYANRWWYMFVRFPETYPVMPPVFRFISVPFHMNVSEDGRVCLNMLERGYMSVTPVVELLQNIKQLFLIPDETTPLQPAKLALYKADRAEYQRKALASAQAVAKATLEDWTRDLYISDDVPADWSLAINPDAGVPPYLRSGVTGKFIPVEKRVVASTGVVYDRDDLRQLLTSSPNPICVITGRPLTENLSDLDAL